MRVCPNGRSGGSAIGRKRAVGRPGGGLAGVGRRKRSRREAF